MKGLIKKIAIIIIITSTIIFSSCERRDILDEPRSSLRININWQKGQKRSEGFFVMLYPKDKSKEVLVDFVGTDGGIIRVPRGEYDILIHSYDYESIIVNRTNSFNSAYATTSNRKIGGILKATSEKDEVILNQTDEMFYTGRFEGKTIEQANASYSVDISPIDIIIQYEYRIKIKNSANIASVYATLSGLSGSYLLGLQKLGANSVSIYSEPTFNEKWIVIKVNTFGIISGVSHKLNLKFTLTDGSTQIESFDVTDNTSELPNGGIITLETTIISLNDVVGSGGIGGTVSEWGSEDIIDIIM